MRTRSLLAGLLAVSAATVGLAVGNAQASGSGAPVAPEVSNGSVIYSNLGPGGSYVSFYGDCVSEPSSSCGAYQAMAMPFTGNGSRVTQIDLGLTNYSGTNKATVQLAQDDGGQPGAVLGSWSVSNQPAWGTCCQLTTIQVSPTIPVGAGRRYWVVAYPGPSNDTADIWMENYYHYAGPQAVNHGSGWVSANQFLTAFDVLGCGKVCKV